MEKISNSKFVKFDSTQSLAVGKEKWIYIKPQLSHLSISFFGKEFYITENYTFSFSFSELIRSLYTFLFVHILFISLGWWWHFKFILLHAWSQKIYFYTLMTRIRYRYLPTSFYIRQLITYRRSSKCSRTKTKPYWCKK